MSRAFANTATMYDLPSRKSVVRGFLNRHSLKKEADPITVLLEPAIYWTDVTLLLLQRGFGQPSQTLIDDPTSGLLFNMLNRNCEAVEGSVVAFLSECGPTSELSSRAAIEFSATILYILQGDRRARLLSYFDDYITGVRQQVKRWRDTTTKFPVASRDEHNRAAAQRELANEALAQAVEEMRLQFGVGGREVWPNVAGRFEGIGRADHYRTVYSRLSSQTHSDAEETLRYFVGVISGSEELMNRMGIETVEFTRMMLLFAVSDFVKASIAFASIHDWSGHVAKLRDAVLELDGCLVEVSPRIGGLQ